MRDKGLYIQKTVHPADSDCVLKKLDFIPINEALRKEKIVTLNFRMKLSDEKYENVELSMHAAKINANNRRVDEVVVTIRLINTR